MEPVYVQVAGVECGRVSCPECGGEDWVRQMLDESDFTKCRASDVNMLGNLVRFVIVKLNSVSISTIMEAKSLILAVILL